MHRTGEGHKKRKNADHRVAEDGGVNEAVQFLVLTRSGVLSYVADNRRADAEIKETVVAGYGED